MSIQATKNGILIDNKLYYVKITQNKRVTVINNTAGNVYQNAQMINDLVASLFKTVIAKNNQKIKDPSSLSLKIDYKKGEITKVTANQLVDKDLKKLKLQKIGMISGLKEINNVETAALKIVNSRYQSISVIPENISSSSEDLILDEEENSKDLVILEEDTNDNEKNEIVVPKNNVDKMIKNKKKTKYKIIYGDENDNEIVNGEIADETSNENTDKITFFDKIKKFFKKTKKNQSLNNNPIELVEANTNPEIQPNDQLPVQNIPVQTKKGKIGKTVKKIKNFFNDLKDLPSKIFGTNVGYKNTQPKKPNDDWIF